MNYFPKIDLMNDFEDRIKWNIFYSPQIEIELFDQSQEKIGNFWEDIMGEPEWDKLRTIEEMSEGFLFGPNSKDTTGRDIKIITPLLVQSEIEQIHQETPLVKKKLDQRVDKENLKTQSQLNAQNIAKEYVKMN